MRALDHKDIENAMLLSSTIAEPDLTSSAPWWSSGEVVWNIATAYVLGDYVIRSETHRVYVAIQASTGKTPEDYPEYWEDVAPTNKWAAFDMLTSTSVYSPSPFTQVVRTGTVTDVDLSGMDNVGFARLRVLDSSDSVLYDNEQSAHWWGGDPWISYYFEMPYQRRRVKFSNLSVGATDKIELTLTSDDGFDIEVSQVAYGRYVDLGLTEYGIEMRMKNYGSAETDKWGNTTIKTGLVVIDLVGSDVVDYLDANRVVEFAIKNRNRAMIWEAKDNPAYDYLSTTGIADVTARPEGPNHALLSISIQGVGA